MSVWRQFVSHVDGKSGLHPCQISIFVIVNSHSYPKSVTKKSDSKHQMSISYPETSMFLFNILDMRLKRGSRGMVLAVLAEWIKLTSNLYIT